MCSKKGQKERDKFQIGRPWISHLIKKKKLCSLSVFFSSAIFLVTMAMISKMVCFRSVTEHSFKVGINYDICVNIISFYEFSF